MTTSDSAGAFHQEIGRALGKWYRVEMELFRIFDQLAGGNRPINSAIFHAVINLNARIDMMDEVAMVALRQEPARLKEWFALSKKVGKRARKRNHLVHHMPLMNFAEKSPDDVWQLHPSQFDISIRTEKQRQVYTTKRIRETAAEFEALGQDLFKFLGKIAPMYARPPSPGKSP